MALELGLAVGFDPVYVCAVHARDLCDEWLAKVSGPRSAAIKAARDRLKKHVSWTWSPYFSKSQHKRLAFKQARLHLADGAPSDGRLWFASQLAQRYPRTALRGLLPTQRASKRTLAHRIGDVLWGFEEGRVSLSSSAMELLVQALGDIGDTDENLLEKARATIGMLHSVMTTAESEPLHPKGAFRVVVPEGSALDRGRSGTIIGPLDCERYIATNSGMTRFGRARVRIENAEDFGYKLGVVVEGRVRIGLSKASIAETINARQLRASCSVVREYAAGEAFAFYGDHFHHVGFLEKNNTVVVFRVRGNVYLDRYLRRRG